VKLKTNMSDNVGEVRPEGSEKKTLETARRIVALGPICDRCLGRQFAMLSTGLTNEERGRSLKIVLAMEGSDDKQLLEELAASSRQARLKLGLMGEDETCTVCLGAMSKESLEAWADKAAKALQGLEYNTFLVGTRVSGLLAENEEMLLADGGSSYAEPFKSELNREVGKLVAMRTGKAADLKKPDLVVHLNLDTGEVELQISSVYIYSRYRKLARGIPQTRWPCRACKGRGCERCNGTGRMYVESVDELIKPAVMAAFEAEDTTFHGAGREDIDARMLGTGRPFVVEAVRPRKRDADLVRLREEINIQADGKIEVSELSFAQVRLVEWLKDAAFEKTYEALVRFEGDVPEEKLKSVLKELVGSVDQRTPTRVSHRRADKVRTRKVYSADLIEASGRHARIIIRGDSGLYIKELVSGDAGRTQPSLTGRLGVDAMVEELDVTNVGGESDVKVTWNEEKGKG
jgi:tRNA pseudouridine synthase 10